jgi:hypothetical protein
MNGSSTNAISHTVFITPLVVLSLNRSPITRKRIMK